jgi:hypothetical protein
MPPLRRMPRVAMERLSAGQVLRYAGCHEPARGADDDSGCDGPARARGDVLEHDGIRVRLRVPRRAHDFRAEARVRLQAVLCPYGIGVRADLGLFWVVRRPVRVERTGERVPVSWDIRSAALRRWEPPLRQLDPPEQPGVRLRGKCCPGGRYSRAKGNECVKRMLREREVVPERTLQTPPTPSCAFSYI